MSWQWRWRWAVACLLLLGAACSCSAAPGDSYLLTASSAVVWPRQMALCASKGVMMVAAGTAGEYMALVDVTTGAAAPVVSYPGAPFHGPGPLVDGVGTNARINPNPGNLVFDARCNFLYFADTNTQSVRRVNMTDYSVKTLAGNNSPVNTAGVGTAASLCIPRGIALAADESALYVSVQHGIRRIDLGTLEVTDVAGGAGPGGNDTAPYAASFDSPAGIALLGPDALLVADEVGCTLRRVALPSGNVTTLAGLYANCYPTADGVGPAARTYHPFKVAVHPPLGTAYFMEARPPPRPAPALGRGRSPRTLSGRRQSARKPLESRSWSRWVLTPPRPQPVMPPFIRRFFLDATSGTPYSTAPLPFAYAGAGAVPLAGGVVTDFALDPIRQRLYIATYNADRLWSVAVALPPHRDCLGGACILMNGGALALSGGTLTFS